MSIGTETLAGEKVMCIMSFSALSLEDKQNNKLKFNDRHKFKIGDEVIYLNFFYKEIPEDNPVGWMVNFKHQGKSYCASQNYFVIREVWNNLREHFLQDTMDFYL